MTHNEAELEKQPVPTAFTKNCREGLEDPLVILLCPLQVYMDKLKHACDIIDRQAEEIKQLKERAK